MYMTFICSLPLKNQEERLKNKRYARDTREREREREREGGRGYMTTE